MQLHVIYILMKLIREFWPMILKYTDWQYQLTSSKPVYEHWRIFDTAEKTLISQSYMLSFRAKF